MVGPRKHRLIHFLSEIGQPCFVGYQKTVCGARRADSGLRNRLLTKHVVSRCVGCLLLYFHTNKAATCAPIMAVVRPVQV